MQQSLVARTLELVRLADDTSLRQLARDLDISYFWLWRFRRGESAKPDAHVIQRLYEHLSGHKLEIR